MSKKRRQSPSPAGLIKAYMASQPVRARKALLEIQRAIRAAAPGAEMAFSYAIPAFRLGGKPLVWYAGFKEHVSIYPIGDAIRTALSPQLAGYETSKGTVRFPLTAPVPVALVKRLVKARVAENRAAERARTRR